MFFRYHFRYYNVVVDLGYRYFYNFGDQALNFSYQLASLSVAVININYTKQEQVVLQPITAKQETDR